MKEAFYVVLLIVGLMVGWFASGWFGDDQEDDKAYLSFEQATKQSKFNLVRDNYAEFFNIGEKLSAGRSWKALTVVGYSFQYGVDTGDIQLRKVSEEGVIPEEWEVDVKKLELGSAELNSMKIFPTKKGYINKHKDKIQHSQEELIPRKTALGLQRLHGDPAKKIQGLLRESITETLTNIARAMEQEIVITKVNLPKPPKDWQKGLKFTLKYQLGDITPIFDERLRSALPSQSGAAPLPPFEVFEILGEDE